MELAAPSVDVSQLVAAWAEGDRAALDRLLPVLRKELRGIAAGLLKRERKGHSLQPTALINEAYIRLIGQANMQCKGRAHFVGVAAHVMRQILVDRARRRRAIKRGLGQVALSLDEQLVYSPQQSEDLLALDEALARLAEIDPRKGKVVELRFFGGLSTNDIAELLQVSPNTVLRDWSLARAWLRRELQRSFQ